YLQPGRQRDAQSAMADSGSAAADPGRAWVWRLVVPARLRFFAQIPNRMKTKTTLLLLIVAVAVALWIKFYESIGPNTEETKRLAGNVVNFEREGLEGIVIQNGDDRIELRKQDQKWRLEAPFKDQADRGAVENLIADLDGWQKFDAIPAKEIAKDKGKLDEFGLSKGKLKLKLLGKNAPPEITFGNDAALQGKIYVQVGDGGDVLIAA